MKKIRFVRRDEEAVFPTKALPGDIGWDLTAIRKHVVLPYGAVLYDTGIAVSPPEGYYVEIVPRSSLSKTGWMLANSVGIVDRQYVGNIYIALTRVNPDAPPLQTPFCRCQLILRKAEDAVMEEVEDLLDTVRGMGGFGSTDKQNDDEKENDCDENTQVDFRNDEKKTTIAGCYECYCDCLHK
jgi:dUTP pyrophosphatase